MLLLLAAEAFLRSFSGTKPTAVASFVAGRAARTHSPRRTFATTSASSAAPSAADDMVQQQQAPMEKFRKVLLCCSVPPPGCAGLVDGQTGRPCGSPCNPLPDPHHAAASQDYTPTPYLVDSVHLNFLLNEDVTRVESRLRLHPNAASSAAAAGGTPPPLCLDGREGECG